MEEIDLMNMLRHAYLYGSNDGVYATRKDSKRPDLHFMSSDERDKNLKELIEDTLKAGGCSYNSYHGSDCDGDCACWEDALDELIPG